MRQVNFNLNGIIKNIRINVGKKDESAIDAVVEKAVERAVADLNIGLTKEDIKLDTVEFHYAKEGEVVIDSVSVVMPEQTTTINGGNHGNTPVEQEDAAPIEHRGQQAVFGSLVVKKVSSSTPAGNTGTTDGVSGNGAYMFDANADFDTLVYGWDAFLGSLVGMSEEEAYQAKLNYMEAIISAAEANVNTYLEQHPELDLSSHLPYPIPEDEGTAWEGYWELMAQANNWRCYRFMLINNTLREKFREYSTKLDYEMIDYSEIQFGQILATSYIPDSGDYNEFSYFGGHIDPNDPMKYIPNENNDQRYIYCVAMLTVYVTKANAAQLRLRDRNLSTQARDILQRSLAYFRSMISNIQATIAEVKANIANEHADDGENFNLTDYLNNLIPNGIAVPAYQFQPPSKEENFEEAHAEYIAKAKSLKVIINDGGNNQALAQELYEYAAGQFEIETEWQNKNPRYLWHQHGASYWQNQMQIWLRILNGSNSSHLNGP